MRYAQGARQLTDRETSG